jgi:hypothetical protein
VQPLHFRVPGFSHTRQERLGGCACDCACGWGPGSSVVSGFGDGGGSGTNGSGVGGGTSSSGADQAAPMTMKERKGEKIRDQLHPRQAHRKLRSRRHDRRPSAYGTCVDTCQFFRSHRRPGRDAACAYRACATSCPSREYTEQQPENTRKNACSHVHVEHCAPACGTIVYHTTLHPPAAHAAAHAAAHLALPSRARALHRDDAIRMASPPSRARARSVRDHPEFQQPNVCAPDSVHRRSYVGSARSLERGWRRQRQRAVQQRHTHPYRAFTRDRKLYPSLRIYVED